YAVETHAQFIGACEAAVGLPPQARSELVEQMRKGVRATSWDQTVEQMLALLHQRPQKDKPEVARGLLRSGDEKLGGPQHFDTVILGAGPTGLSAAYHLGRNTLVLERGEQVGGNC